MPIVSRRLRAVGITCGIGSMLVGAKMAGYKVLGNIEWRGYYHAKDKEGRSTFTSNFPGAWMVKSIDDLPTDILGDVSGVDLALGHPECGAWSQMQGCNNFRDQATRRSNPSSPCDIPLFTELVSRIRPRYFAMDDLPKSLGAYTMEDYSKALPDYDLFPEWISNYHYGNIQKQRKRMFMIGSLKSERWAFVPGEEEHGLTLSDVIGDLPVFPEAGEIPNHDPHNETEECGRGLHMRHPWHRPTWGEMRKWFEAVGEGQSFRYYSPHSPEGETKVKPGWYKQYWNGTCAVLDGGSGHMHPKRNLPFTIRERARIQGFPDSFVFYGTRLNEDGEWIHERNMDIVKQTGKAMPIQFNRYVARQVKASIDGRKFEPSRSRLITPNEYVTAAKEWYCTNVGYSDQDRACDSCWLRERCNIRGTTGLVQVTISQKTEPKTTKEVVVKTETKMKEKAKVKVKTAPKVERDPIEVIDLCDRKSRPIEVPVRQIEVRRGVIPDDYHCACKFCTESTIGELRAKDGSYYSRNERRAYYGDMEKGPGGHVAKTPLHIARWAVQRFTEEGDWVLDPTVGAGTTIVESLIQRRNAVGMEIQFKDILLDNVTKFARGSRRAVIGIGDARQIDELLSKIKRRFSLIVNNPPYSGDEHWTTYNVPTDAPENTWSSTFDAYDRRLGNIAFLKENEEYWKTFISIYSKCVDYLLPGGRFVIGVKDQMRRKEPDGLHRKFAEVLEQVPGLEFEGTAFLNHYPRTLHLNSYPKLYGVDPPYYQTIVVFKKKG